MTEDLWRVIAFLLEDVRGNRIEARLEPGHPASGKASRVSAHTGRLPGTAMSKDNRKE